jgi:hypothetical protein
VASILNGITQAFSTIMLFLDEEERILDSVAFRAGSPRGCFSNAEGNNRRAFVRVRVPARSCKTINVNQSAIHRIAAEYKEPCVEVTTNDF